MWSGGIEHRSKPLVQEFLLDKGCCRQWYIRTCVLFTERNLKQNRQETRSSIIAVVSERERRR